MRELWAKILNMIKQGWVSRVDKDDGPYPIGQATVNKRATKYTRLSPYGLVSNPPKGTQIILFSSQGQESTKFGIANDTKNRKKFLLDGEAALFNSNTGAFILMKADGSIQVSGQTELFINSNLRVTGTIIDSSGVVSGTHIHEQPNDSNSDIEEDTGPPKSP